MSRRYSSHSRKRHPIPDQATPTTAETDRRLLLMLAHELRNPLNTAVLQIALLRESLNGELKEPSATVKARRDLVVQELRLVMTIERALLRAARLVTGVFDSALMLQGQLVFEHETPVSLSLVLADVQDELQAIYGHRPLEVDIPHDLPPLAAEHGRLDQVLVCLLHNAFRYAKQEKAGVRARLFNLTAETKKALPSEVCLPAGSYVHIEVWDRGPGIPPTEWTQVFRPFYRLKPQAKEARKGLGLGLFICRGLAEGHGGAIWITDTPDGNRAPVANRLPGTTVHVLWPAASRDNVGAHGRRPSQS